MLGAEGGQHMMTATALKTVTLSVLAFSGRSVN
jgi:hypothetical protein